MNRRQFMQTSAGAAAFLAMRARMIGATQGMPLAGKNIAQFVDALPVLSVAGGPNATMETVLADANEVQLHIHEFLANVMPTGFVPANGIPYAGTYSWGYRVGTAVAPTLAPTYIGPVIVATRGLPTQVRFVNQLGRTPTKIPAWDTSVDTTVHFANPVGPAVTDPANFVAYNGPVPTVPHLHGGEVPPELDGGPDSWWTAAGTNGAGNYVGHAYHSKAGQLAGEAIYRYPNSQEASPIWFHDHTLGVTRLNVYAGIAGAYAVIDPLMTLPAGLHAVGLQQGATGKIDYSIPLVIQDRMFDTNGQLYFPNVGINPTIHPLWIPEFLGDVITVNGKVWPFLDVEARRYRFYIINGSHARTYELSLPSVSAGNINMWQIATDGGYLDAPAPLKTLLIMPGERAEIIIDFAGLPPGTKLVLKNSARSPYPGGGPPNGSTIGQVLQFRVTASTLGGPDLSYNPAAAGATLRAPGQQIIRLANPATGVAAVVPDVKRQLTLNEVLGPLGPVKVLLNNTEWDGISVAGNIFPGGVRPDFALPVASSVEYISERPTEGKTELWEIINLTADAHPIHLHLVQFQLINRQAFSVKNYNAVYNALFPASPAIDPMTGLPYPGAVFIGGYGPPLPYDGSDPRSASGTLGGNPDVTPFLKGAPVPPPPNEAGWKDTLRMMPGEVTRIMVRYMPVDKPLGASGADAAFPFNPDGHGYVWHCHIMDHEDNEMMRPQVPVPNASALRTYIKGGDY